MAGWGGVFASAVAGAAEGAGAAGVQDITEQQKQAALNLRDQNLAMLERGNYAAKSAVDTAAIGPRADATAAATARNATKMGEAQADQTNAFNFNAGAGVAAQAGAVAGADAAAKAPYTSHPAGSSVQNADGTWSTAPNKSPDAYYDSMTNKNNAEAAYKNAEARGEVGPGSAQAQKAIDPAYTTVTKDPLGNVITAVNEGAHVMRTTVPGKPVQPGEFRLFGANDPDTPATADTFVYRDTETNNILTPAEVASRFPKSEAAHGNAPLYLPGPTKSTVDTVDPDKLPPMTRADHDALTPLLEQYQNAVASNKGPDVIAPIQQQIRAIVNKPGFWSGSPAPVGGAAQAAAPAAPAQAASAAPAVGSVPGPAAGGLPPGLPPGAVPSGRMTPDGKPLYKTPDGKLWTAG